MQCSEGKGSRLGNTDLLHGYLWMFMDHHYLKLFISGAVHAFDLYFPPPKRLSHAHVRSVRVTNGVVHCAVTKRNKEERIKEKREEVMKLQNA